MIRLGHEGKLTIGTASLLLILHRCRGRKYADKFWFSLFHEIAHIIYGHIGNAEGTTEKDEKCADEYAKNTLIPEEQYDTFLRRHEFSN